ncbi:MAG: hypothetical protein Kow0037_23550 [Calditrichia bacterium]
MEQGRVTLNLLLQKIEKLKEFKGLLLQQQKALVAVDMDAINRFSELQLNCLEEIQAIEAEWRRLIESVKARYNLQNISTDQVVTLGLDEEKSVMVLGYIQQVRQLVEEIEKVKKNNALLIQNSLSLVRSTLRHLQGGMGADAVYNPYRRPTPGNLILNRKL